MPKGGVGRDEAGPSSPVIALPPVRPWPLRLAVGLAAVVGALSLVTWPGIDIGGPVGPVPARSSLLQASAWVLAVLTAYVLVARLFEHRRVRELLGGVHGILQLLAGSLVGLLLVLACLHPWWTVIGRDPGFYVRSLAGAAALAGALVAIPEELIFRGLLLRIPEERLGSWLALAVSSLLFAAAHYHPAFTFSEAVNHFVAGVMLGAAFLLTRRLWLGIGLHAGWNCAILGLWYVGVLQMSSVAGTIVIGAAAAALLALVWARRLAVPPRRRAWLAAQSPGALPPPL